MSRVDLSRVELQQKQNKEEEQNERRLLKVDGRRKKKKNLTLFIDISDSCSVEDVSQKHYKLGINPSGVLMLIGQI